MKRKGYNYLSAVKRKRLLDEHAKYLNTDTWAGKRELVLRRDNYTCQKCHRYGGRLHVHHKTYKRHEAERIQDLITFCEDCHNRVHS